MEFEMEFKKEIARNILNQLNFKKIELLAWGSKDFLIVERKINKKIYPALEFSIRTPKVKKSGKVIISLDIATDSYIVEAVRFYGKEISLGIVTGVYFDKLHETINSLIEDEDTYFTAFF